MKYRDIEYSLVQGTERQIWKWSVTIGPEILAAGQTVTKAEAVGRAEEAIDRALAPKLRLVSSRGSDDGTP
jgi:hypothetical protein